MLFSGGTVVSLIPLNIILIPLLGGGELVLMMPAMWWCGLDRNHLILLIKLALRENFPVVNLACFFENTLARDRLT